ncbi:MAG TPA: 50S ribosomal protein L4 [Candidatus Saccharimonadales bacterium]|jgi:large subunit ribosomal protein L4|nr:50S ribosomal protein L4 [Candidatus Saccharimonadales bacterium]
MATTKTAVPTFTKTGTKATTAVKLNEAIFAIMPENHELLKLAYSAYLANGRDNLAVTKTRGLVSGGGKKPWKQKGTGRARFGSSRNPIWRGGGIAFGPTGIENYSIKVNVTAKRLAIRQALSLSAAEGRIRIVESLDFKDGKVAPFAKLLTKIEATGNVLVVVDNKDAETERATNNLQNVMLVQANYLNVFNIMNADVIVISEKSLAIINEWLGGAK